MSTLEVMLLPLLLCVGPWVGWYLFCCLMAGLPVFGGSDKSRLITALVVPGHVVALALIGGTGIGMPILYDLLFGGIPAAGILTALALVGLRAWKKFWNVRGSERKAEPLPSSRETPYVRILMPLLALALLFTRTVLPERPDYAGRARSMNNMEMIVRACWTYAHDHGNEWPTNLGALVEGGYVDKELLTNPRQPEREVGYIYLPWRDGDELTAVVLYEAFDSWPDAGLCVGFAYEHAEVVDDRRELGRLLASGWQE